MEQTLFEAVARKFYVKNGGHLRGIGRDLPIVSRSSDVALPPYGSDLWLDLLDKAVEYADLHGVYFIPTFKEYQMHREVRQFHLTDYLSEYLQFSMDTDGNTITITRGGKSKTTEWCSAKYLEDVFPELLTPGFLRTGDVVMCDLGGPESFCFVYDRHLIDLTEDGEVPKEVRKYHALDWMSVKRQTFADVPHITL